MTGSSNASPAFSGKKAVASTETPVLSPAASWIWSYMFDYGELAEATDGFAARNLIGEGGFGFVYKGRLPDGKEVAVKRLKKTGSPRAERQFQAEVEIISRVHHRNLVSLLGYCICKDQRLLIYEFVLNGTLEQHLHGSQMPELLNWDRRMNIAVGAARGLAYLHQDCHPQIIHCDVKSSNILLDQTFNPKVSDFGLAILMSDPYGHLTTHVVGTLGYLAPDYPLSGKMTDKSDVYSFGVLLLEIVTGKKPIDTAMDSDYGSLAEWGQPLLEKVLEERDVTIILDPRLQNGSRCNEDEVLRVLEVAASCLNPSPKCRPRMSQVVRMLEKEDRSSLQHPPSADGAADSKQQEADATNQLALAKVFRMMACADHHHLIDHTGACSIDFDATSFFSKSSSTQ
ncbi:Proline-rich receptor-like protein kinase [Nymphaea thermarum]|nr:Proline-rich receptor-like protein kinase [Nymphaea thermarum]